MKNTKTYICWLIRKWDINKQLQMTLRLTLVMRLVQKCLCGLCKWRFPLLCSRVFLFPPSEIYGRRTHASIRRSLPSWVSTKNLKRPNPGQFLIQHSIQLISKVIKHVPDVIQNVPCRLHYVRSAKRDAT